MVIPNENVEECVGILQAAFQDQLKGHKVIGSFHVFLTERNNETTSQVMVVHRIPQDFITEENFDRVFDNFGTILNQIEAEVSDDNE